MQPDNHQPSDDQNGITGAQEYTYIEPELDEQLPPDGKDDSWQLQGEDELVRWQAAEYINKSKNNAWYAWLSLVVVGLIAFAIFVIDSYSFAVLIPIMAVSLVLYIKRPAPVLDYILSRKGLHINDKLHPYEYYREFGLAREGADNMIILIPRKRFGLGLSFYFPEEVGEAVVDILAARLPMRDVKPDILDRIIKKLGM